MPKKNKRRDAQIELENDQMNTIEGDDAFEEKSRSQIKREMEALQKLGLKISQLNTEQRKKVPLSDELREAIDVYLKIKSNEAKRRQMQFIGKLMRSEDIEPIQYQVDLFDSSSLAHSKHISLLEDWRERLITDEKKALSEWLQQYPQTDIQAIRALVRQAIKDRQTDKQTGAAKKLFRLIKATVESED